MSTLDPFNILLDYFDIARLDAQSFQAIENLQGGRAFLDWLVLQTRLSSNSLELDAIHVSQSLRATTLDKEEADCADTLGRGEKSHDHAVSVQGTPAELRRQAQWKNSEIEILEHELRLLRSRLEQTRAELKRANKGIKQLRRALDDVQRGLSDRRNQLHELSIEIDTSITTALDSATMLLKSTGIFEGEGYHEADQLLGDATFSLPNTVSDAHRILSHSKANFSTTLSILEKMDDHLAGFSQAENQKCADVESEAARLVEAFSNFDFSINRLDDPRIVVEVERVIQELEEKQDLSPVDVLLWLEGEEKRLAKRQEGSVPPAEIDVQDLLQSAWRADQGDILAIQETSLDEAEVVLARILKELQDLHGMLKGIFSHINSVQVVLEAFAEELRDIKVETHDPAPSGLDESLALEKALKATIEKFKGVRPQGAQPLVLLTQQDVLRELGKIKEQLDQLESEEADWAEVRLLEYRERPLHPALQDMYAHSPLNTSPPFALPSNLQALEQTARDRAKTLQDLFNGLEKEAASAIVKEKKRLGRFVSGWCG